MFTKMTRNCFVSLLCLLIYFAFQFGSPTSSYAVKQGGVLKIAIGGQPSKMDPPNTTSSHDQQMMAHIYEVLLAYHYDGKTKMCTPKPILAEKWTLSKDGKVYTFYLRKGVKFHDGTPFNATAVKFNIDRMMAEKPRTLYGRDVTGGIDHTEVVGEYTIKIHLSKPIAIFLHLLGDFKGAMVSPTALKKYGDDISRYPTGTGPFKFVKWATGDYLEVEVFKEYWGGRAPLDGIVFRFVPDSNARINMLQMGEVDVALNIPIQDHERLRKTDKIDIISWPIAALHHFYLDNAVPPTNELKVRQAIKLAIDTEAVTRDIFQGTAKPADSCLAPFTWGYFPANPHSYNPEKAKKLLEECGWIDRGGDGYRERDGKKLGLTIYAPLPDYMPMCGESLLAIQEYLRKVGFECKVNALDFSAFLSEYYRTLPERVQKEKDEKRGTAYFIDWGSRSDGWFTLYNKMNSRVWYPDKKHTSFYRNTEFDSLIDKAEVEVDPQKRFELYKKAQIIEAQDTPIIHLWVVSHALGKRKYVHGIQAVPLPVADSHSHAREAWIEK